MAVYDIPAVRGKSLEPPSPLVGSLEPWSLVKNTRDTARGS